MIRPTNVQEFLPMITPYQFFLLTMKTLREDGTMTPQRAKAFVADFIGSIPKANREYREIRQQAQAEFDLSAPCDEVAMMVNASQIKVVAAHFGVNANLLAEQVFTGIYLKENPTGVTAVAGVPSGHVTWSKPGTQNYITIF